MTEETLDVLEGIERIDFLLKQKGFVFCPAPPKKTTDRRHILSKIR